MIKEELLDKMEYLYNGRDYENLINVCDELLKLDKDNPIALNYKGISLYYLEKYDESLDILNYNLKLHPKNPYTLNNIALVYIALGEYEKALEYCERGLKQKDFDWLQINKIESLIYLDRIDEARDFYKSVNIAFYTFDEALSNCGKFEKGDKENNLEELFKNGEHEKVIELCNSLKSSEITLEYKIVSLFYLKEISQALECVDDAIKTYPYNYNFCFIKARISLISGNWDDAIENYERAFELTSTNNSRLEVNDYIGCLEAKADELIDAGEYEKAIDNYEKILIYRQDKFEIIARIDELNDEFGLNYQPNENYEKTLKNRKYLKDKIYNLEIQKVNADDCMEFRNYSSFDEYMIDVIGCLNQINHHYDEIGLKEMIMGSISIVEHSFISKEPALGCALGMEFNSGGRLYVE